MRDTHVGGLLTGKAVITHLHAGEEPSRLSILREIITDYHVRPERLYPTHVERNAQLMDEALELAGAGAYVDMDTVNGDLIRWFRHEGEVVLREQWLHKSKRSIALVGEQFDGFA